MQPQDEVWPYWKGLNPKSWRTKPSWLQTLCSRGPCLPLLPSDFSTAITADQMQQLVTLYVVPVVPAKHQIKAIEHLQKLPSLATTGRQLQFRLPPVRVPQQQCLEPSKLLVRRLQGLAFEKESKYWKLTLQRVACPQFVRLHALICHARHGPPPEGHVAMHLCGKVMHPPLTHCL